MTNFVTSSADDCWFIYQNDCLLLLRRGDDYTLLSSTDLNQLQTLFVRQHTVGLYHNKQCIAAEIPASQMLSPEMIAMPLRQALQLLGITWYYAAVKAYSIINWDKNHAYCGHCGNKTEHRGQIFERICPHCRLTVYPRISPSIIVLIKRNDEILMARSPHFRPGIFGLIAGFVDAGETLEQAVHREVLEEVGITIKNLMYFGSQPWPFPDSLMIGYMAEYHEGELKLDTTEIEAADWYHYTNLPPGPSSLSISGRLIEAYLAERNGLDKGKNNGNNA